MSVEIVTASENRDSQYQEDIHKETWKVEHVELATELTMLPHPHPEPPRSKLRGKSRRFRSPSPPQRNCHPVVWAAVANRHVSPRYETQSYVGLQLVVKMENYKFSN